LLFDADYVFILPTLFIKVKVVNAKMLEINNEIRGLQKESYFINLERKRKIGVIQTLKDEIEEEKRKKAIKKAIEAKIKKHVISP
jgi:hypothetical protein